MFKKELKCSISICKPSHPYSGSLIKIKLCTICISNVIDKYYNILNYKYKFKCKFLTYNSVLTILLTTNCIGKTICVVPRCAGSWVLPKMACWSMNNYNSMLVHMWLVDLHWFIDDWLTCTGSYMLNNGLLTCTGSEYNDGLLLLGGLFISLSPINPMICHYWHYLASNKKKFKSTVLNNFF